MDNNIDEMCEQSKLDFGIETIINYLKQTGYEILGVNNELDKYPNIVAYKDEQRYAILVKADEVRKQPKLSIKDKFNMIRYYRVTNIVPLFASLGFGAVNHDRFEKGILLENDPEGYNCNFAGLENINIENIPEKNTDEYITHVVHLLGECFESKDMSLLEPYIDENINFFHFMKNIKIKTKYELLKYFNQTFEKNFNADYKSYMIEFVGNWFKIKTSSLMLASGEILKNANVTLPQPGGSLGLIIERFLNNKKDAVAIAIQFNENKLINDIYFGDPYAMNFKDSDK